MVLIGDQGVSLLYGWQIYNINQTPDGSYSFTQSSNLANRDLTWETSNSHSKFGFESVLFDDKLTLDLIITLKILRTYSLHNLYLVLVDQLLFNITMVC